MDRLNTLLKIQKPKTITDFKQQTLNLILIFLIVLTILCLVTTFYNFLISPQTFGGVNPFLIPMFLIIFCSLYWLASNGYFDFASSTLIISLLTISILCSIRWGSLLPLAILLYVLTIILTGILKSVRVSVILASLVSIFLTGLSYLQYSGYLPYDNSWTMDRYDLGDAFIVGITFFIISSLVWFSKLNLELLYKQAISYEEILRERNVALEDLVSRRTTDLKKAQGELLIKFNSLAELKTSSAGLFHDLANLLTAVRLSVENMSLNTPGTNTEASPLAPDINRTLSYLDKVQRFLGLVSKQFKTESTSTWFSVMDELNQTMEIFNYKIKQLKIRVEIISDSDTKIYGSSIKFFQIIKNLIGNSIDALKVSPKREKNIRISLNILNNNLIIDLYDNGVGINQANLERVFDPFFTTKGDIGGTGLGLSICKELLENEFSGTINVSSLKDEWTRFTLHIPIKVM